LVVPELAYLEARTSHSEALGFSHNAAISGAGAPRICWLLFDELSYDQVYEHRAAGLELPNFDRLRRASTTFTNVTPAGNYTNIAIPSMFLGRPASRMKSSDSGGLSLYMSDVQRWERFDASTTVFANARRLGWTSGIVGWANPYCRVMAAWVDDCYWIPEDDPIITQTNMDPSRGVVANAVSMPLQWWHSLIPAGLSNGQEYNRQWVADRQHHYDLAMERAGALIQNSSIRFQFIHLPVPHPPAIYDRKTRQRSDHGSYLDNLALADVALGELLDQLERTPNWPQTTLIVSGDHSWRPWVWKHLDFWTKEDEVASRGQYDPRPVIAIHLPGERHESTITSEFQAVGLASLIDAIMQDRIHTPDELRTRASGPD
jgi:arylsulfatase A-like enzyme